MFVILFVVSKLAAPCENMSSAQVDSEGPDQSAHPQSDQGFPCPLTELLAITVYMNGKQTPG